jgi:hypothetical protein
MSTVFLSYDNKIDVCSIKIELFDWHRNVTIYHEQQAKPIEIYQFIASSLKKYTNYSVRINCATKIGSGPWSTPVVYLQTFEDGNVRFIVLSSNRFHRDEEKKNSIRKITHT